MNTAQRAGNLRRGRIWHIISPFRSLIKSCLEYGRLKEIYGKEVARANTFSFKKQAKKYLTGVIENQTGEGVSDAGITFSILVPVYNTPEKYLREMISSVQAQTYRNFELILSDASDKEHSYVENVCLSYAKDDQRIIYRHHDKRLAISENTNEALSLAGGDYVAFLDHDDKLMLSALAENARAIKETNADVLYSDEYTFLRDDPLNVGTFFFKQDFSLYDLRGLNYVCHFLVVRRRLVNELGGLRNTYDGAQDHDLILRLAHRTGNIVHIPKLLYRWRDHSDSTASGAAAKSYVTEAGRAAVEAELTSANIRAGVTSSSAFPTVFHVRYMEGESVEMIRVEDDGKTDVNRIMGRLSSMDKGLMLVHTPQTEIEDRFLKELTSMAMRIDVGAVGGLLIDKKGNIVSGGIEKRDQKNIFVTLSDRGSLKVQSAYNRRLFYARSVDGVEGLLLMRTGVFLECAADISGGHLIPGICAAVKKHGYHVISDPYGKVKIS